MLVRFDTSGIGVSADDVTDVIVAAAAGASAGGAELTADFVEVRVRYTP